MNPATAPCGCPGEHIIGQYVRCLRGCDSGSGQIRPDPAKFADAHHPCVCCGSHRTIPWTHSGPSKARACHTCGAVW